MRESHGRVAEKLRGDLLSRTDLLNVATELRLITDTLARVAEGTSYGVEAEPALTAAQEDLLWVRENRDSASGPELLEKVAAASREVADAIVSLGEWNS